MLQVITVDVVDLG